MRKPRIYTQQSLACGLSVSLEEKPSRHLGKVLRIAVGASIVLFNGDGGQYEATVTDVGKKKITVDIDSFDTINKPSPLSIHLGIAVSKGDRMDTVMQKSTELGVTQITPIFSSRSEVKLKSERAEKKLSHWRQISISASEQCGRNILPKIQPFCSVEQWITGVTAQNKFVLHHRAAQKLSQTSETTDVALLIGPEGGLDEEEIALALRQQFLAISLGPRILRTETAPLTALSIMQFLWGDI